MGRSLELDVAMSVIRTVIAATLALAGPAGAANLAPDGSFEQPTAPAGAFSTFVAGQTLGPWTVEAGGVDLVHAGFWQAFDGSQSIDLNGGDPGGVVQTIATQPGVTYEITYALAGNSACGTPLKTLAVHWGGSIAASVAFDATSTSPMAMGWTVPRALLVTATAPTTQLAFRASSPAGGCGPALDRVEVVPRAVTDRGLRLVSAAASGATTGNAVSYTDLVREQSADGRFVLFASEADNLVAGDTNGKTDVFVRDVDAGTTTLISVAAGTTQSANGESFAGALSLNGRYVAFFSRATNLATSGPNPASATQYNAWLHDRQAGTTRLVSVDSSGAAAIGARTSAVDTSEDGRYVLFETTAPNVVAPPLTTGTTQIYLRDMQSGVTLLVSRNSAGTGAGNAEAYRSMMSRDGRYVAFESSATDYVTAPDLNGRSDVFVFDRVTTTTARVSHVPGGAAGNAGSQLHGISGNGTLIVFESDASDLVSGDGNGRVDVFAYRTADGGVVLASCAGACVASASEGASDIIVSDTGRYVAFESSSAELVPPDANAAGDVYLRDLELGTLERISIDTEAFDDGSDVVGLSSDGRWVLFATSATATPDDVDNRGYDLFARDRQTGRTYLLSRGEHGSSNDDVNYANVSANGRRAVLDTDATTLTDEVDANGRTDVFTVELGALDRVFADGFE